MAEKTNYRCTPYLQKFYTGGPLAVSSDGVFLACACNRAIKIVNSADASVRGTLLGDSENVTALTLSPDDRFLFSASHSRLIRVWDMSSFKCIRSWKATGHDGLIMGMSCHYSEELQQLLATAGADKKVLIWDVDGGFCTHFFKGHQGVVTSITFHPDPKRLLLFSGSDDTTVRVWNLQTKKCISVLEKHFSAVTSLAISANGQNLLTAGRDKVVNIWSLQSCSLITTIPTFEMVETVCVVCPETVLSTFIPPTDLSKKTTKDFSLVYFLTVGERGLVRIWCSEGATCLYEQQTSDATICSDEDGSTRGFTKAFVLPSNQGLLCVTADQQFLFYSTSQSIEEPIQLHLRRRLVGYNEEIADLKFLGEDEQFLAVATNLEQVRVYDISSMSCSYVLAGHTDTVLCLDTCLSNGKILIVTGSKDKNVRLWESGNQQCVGVGTGHMGAVSAIAFSKKGRDFFVSGSSDGTIKMWSIDGVFLKGEANEAKLKTKAIIAAHSKRINSIAVSPNDSLICTGSKDCTACIWKLPNLALSVVLKGHKKEIRSVEFSPVDQCVLTSSGDQRIKIWAVSDGSCLKTFEGHTSKVLKALFLSNGTQIVSSGADCLVKLWTVKTNECVATYDEHEDKILALAVGRKTEMLATGGGDAAVNLWHDSSAADKEEAFHKEEEEILRGQELENAVIDEDYTHAIKLAIDLRRPHKLYELFALICRRGIADQATKNALRSLGKEETRFLLESIREWNTKIKFCHVASFVLMQFFKLYSPKEIIEIKGIGEILDGIYPYTQRHYRRMDRLVRNTCLLSYALEGMSVIEPDMSFISTQESSLLKNKTTQENALSNDARNEQENSSDANMLSKNKTTQESTLSNDARNDQENVSDANKISKNKSTQENTLSNDAGNEQKNVSDANMVSKKRKRNKSRKGAEKKIKEMSQKDATAISLQS